MFYCKHIEVVQKVKFESNEELMLIPDCELRIKEDIELLDDPSYSVKRFLIEDTDFQCSLCDKSFSHNTHIKTHLQTHNRIQTVPM